MEGDIYNKMKNLILTLLLSFCLNNHLFSQSQGPLNPVSYGTDASIGTFNWINFGDVLVSDDSRSSVILDNSGDDSYYLTATNFGFTIPIGSVIDGIVIEIEISDSGGGNIKDNSVKIIKGGVISGMDNASGANWPLADAYRTYGNGIDLWGATWTDADINASNFGVAISARRTGGGGNNRARIDHIRITVYYTVTLPIELLSFTGNKSQDKNILNWITISELNNNYFVIEKSSNGVNFNNLGIVKGAGNSNIKIEYTLIDSEPYNVTYYKLSQIDYNGDVKSFNTISVSNINTDNIRLVRITNLLGQDTKDTCDCLKMYHFSDGSVIKNYTIR